MKVACQKFVQSILELAYQRDNNAAAHSVDIDIFQSSDSSICALQDLTLTFISWRIVKWWGICPCMHQLHVWWHIDGELWQGPLGIVTKNHTIIWLMIHINFSFTRSRKSKDVSRARVHCDVWMCINLHNPFKVTYLTDWFIYNFIMTHWWRGVKSSRDKKHIVLWIMFGSKDAESVRAVIYLITALIRIDNDILCRGRVHRDEGEC